MAKSNKETFVGPIQSKEETGSDILKLPVSWGTKEKEQKISARLLYPYLKENVQHDFSSEVREIEKNISNLISQYLIKRQINFSQVHEAKMIKQGLLKGVIVLNYTENGKEKNVAFNLHTNNKPEVFLGGTVENIQEFKERNISQSGKLTEKAENILDAMEYIFTQNQKEIFGHLKDYDDILDTDKFGTEIQGLNLKNLSELLKETMIDYDFYRSDVDEGVSLPSDKIMLQIREKYLDIIMGIGDKYEGGAEYINKRSIDFSDEANESNVFTAKISNGSVESMVSSSSPFEILKELKLLLKKRNKSGETILQDVLNQKGYDDILHVTKSVTYKQLSEKLKSQVSVISNIILQIKTKESDDFRRRFKAGIPNPKKTYFLDKKEFGNLFVSAKNSQSHGLGLLDIVLRNKDTPELIKYVKKINRSIDENNFQSTPVEKSYQIFSDSLHKEVLQKLKDSNADDIYFLEFVRTISGDNEDATWIGKGGVDNAISSNDTTTEIINEVLLHLLSKRNGLLEKVKIPGKGKILESLQDKEIGEEKPQTIVNEFKNLVDSKITGGGNRSETKEYFKNIGYSSLLQITHKTDYTDLKLEEKAKISVIYRMLKKLKLKDTLLSISNSKNSPENYYLYGKTGDSSFLEIPEENIKRKEASLNLDQLSELFLETTIETQEDLVEQITDTFQGKEWAEWAYGKDAKSIGLVEKVDVDIYNFFKEYQGVGALDISNRSFHNSLFAGQLAATIAIAMGTLPVSGAIGAATNSGRIIKIVSKMRKNSLREGGNIGTIAGITSVIMNPKGSDSIIEGIVNPLTEIGLGRVTGYIGGGLVGGFKQSKILSKIAPKKSKIQTGWGVEGAKRGEKGFIANKAIFASDLAFLGMGTEVIRMMTVDGVFHEESIYSDEKIKD